MQQQLARFGIALMAAALCASATGQVYPGKPVRWIVPYPPGGSTDIIARWNSCSAWPRWCRVRACI